MVVERHVDALPGVWGEVHTAEVVVGEVDMGGTVGIEYRVVGGVRIIHGRGHQHTVEVLIVTVARRHLPEEAGREGGVGRNMYLFRHEPAAQGVVAHVEVEVAHVLITGHVVGDDVDKLASLGFVPADEAVGEGLLPRQREGRRAVDDVQRLLHGVGAESVDGHHREGILGAAEAGTVAHPGAVAQGVGGDDATHSRRPGVVQPVGGTVVEGNGAERRRVAVYLGRHRDLVTDVGQGVDTHPHAVDALAVRIGGDKGHTDGLPSVCA